MEILIILAVLFVIVILPIGWAIATYNGFVRLRNLVQEAWRQIDVELQRRHDLIPNLVETVKGYAAHERAVFDEVTRARALASGPASGPAEQAAHENVLTQAIGRLFAVAEAYPQLRASENFQQLQSELTNTEDRIAAGRRFYNANVRELNTKVESFPSNLIAKMFTFERAEYFETEDPAVRQAPTIDFGQGSGTPPAVG
ncbi:MAG: LemA family protein [Actinomycetota bacterium]|nr:LemA family protein [Actinomycetota bacterium]